jgi:hypothetical protein
MDINKVDLLLKYILVAAGVGGLWDPVSRAYQLVKGVFLTVLTWKEY